MTVWSSGLCYDYSWAIYLGITIVIVAIVGTLLCMWSNGYICSKRRVPTGVMYVTGSPGVSPYGAPMYQPGQAAQMYPVASQAGPYGAQMYPGAATAAPYGVQTYPGAATAAPYGVQAYPGAATAAPYGVQAYGTGYPASAPNGAN